VALSCNAYFRALAGDTPPPLLASVFAQEGFRGEPATPDQALGLAEAGEPVLIAPGDLLAAYARLVGEPWNAGEPVRGEVLAGLRASALQGTAGALGQRGWWAKTGTVPFPDGDPTRTVGLLVAVDDSGWAVLARRTPGTGREAAAALGPELARLRPGFAAQRPAPALRETSSRASLPAAAPGLVRVRLLDLLGAGSLEARNLGPAPIPAGDGFLGPGAARALRAGDRLGPGLLELRDPASGLLRRLEGSLRAGRTPRGALALTALLTRREYAAGVLAAELPHGSSPRRLELAAAVLRFLDQGPRHPDAEVCDSTHCAWFVGRGPRVAWASARRAVVQAEDGSAGADPPTDAEWAAVLDAAARPGPSLWSAHCGGAPLAPHALWGRGDAATTPCPRHDGGNARPWSRAWRAADLARAFGVPVRGLRVEHLQGVWTLRVDGEGGAWSLRYDEVHRRLAAVLGWDALPSPADAVDPAPGGFIARGRGWGHRVGLCLGD
jgi:hypothetical protein